MGGRGASSSNVGKEIILPSGEKIDIGEKLVYGGKEYIPGREDIEKWEAMRVKNKIEYAIVINDAGIIMSPEYKGGKNGVKIPWYFSMKDNATLTHIHPRKAGMLGGTFSQADLVNFANGRWGTYRAVAKEGTYSIHKKKNFDALGFKMYISGAHQRIDTAMKKDQTIILSKYRERPQADIIKDYNKRFNQALAELHNAYREGQKKFGYSYSLERR